MSYLAIYIERENSQDEIPTNYRLHIHYLYEEKGLVFVSRQLRGVKTNSVVQGPLF